MAGTKIGSIKAVETILTKNPNFFIEIGRRGGIAQAGRGGYASKVVGKDGLTGQERAKLSGSIGGRKSKRQPTQKYLYQGVAYTRTEIAELMGVSLPTATKRVAEMGLELV